jgi:hypothetical protein
MCNKKGKKKQTYVIRKEGLPDVGKLGYVILLTERLQLSFVRRPDFAVHRVPIAIVTLSWSLVCAFVS